MARVHGKLSLFRHHSCGEERGSPPTTHTHTHTVIHTCTRGMQSCAHPCNTHAHSTHAHALSPTHAHMHTRHPVLCTPMQHTRTQYTRTRTVTHTCTRGMQSCAHPCTRGMQSCAHACTHTHRHTFVRRDTRGPSSPGRLLTAGPGLRRAVQGAGAGGEMPRAE